MTEEAEEGLAEVKILAELLMEKEEGEFKSIRRRRMNLDEQRRRLKRQADQARREASATLTDVPIVLNYLEAVATQILRLDEEEETVIAEERSQKDRLRIALARKLRLEDSENL